jgi:hypothetical protein
MGNKAAVTGAYDRSIRAEINQKNSLLLPKIIDYVFKKLILQTQKKISYAYFYIGNGIFTAQFVSTQAIIGPVAG